MNGHDGIVVVLGKAASAWASSRAESRKAPAGPSAATSRAALRHHHAPGIVDSPREVVERRGERQLGLVVAATRSGIPDLACGQAGAAFVPGQLHEQALAAARGDLVEGERGRGGGRRLRGRSQRGEEAPRRPRQAYDRSRPLGGLAQPLQGLPTVTAR